MCLCVADDGWSTTTTTTTTTTTRVQSSQVVLFRELSVLAIDEHSVTLSWQRITAAADEAGSDVDVSSGDTARSKSMSDNTDDVLYEWSFWRSDQLNSSTTTVMSRSENVTVLGLLADTRYCFTVTPVPHSAHTTSTWSTYTGRVHTAGTHTDS